MIFEIQNQCLAFLLSLRERLFPARFRQLCRGIWVGFIPMVLSPIGFSRFRRETFRFLLLSNREFYLSKSKKRFQTWIWDPGENGPDYKAMKNKSVDGHLIYRIGYWFFRQRRMVAQGVQKSVSKTSMLVNFLPTGTLLVFEMFLPSIYRDGDCNGINTPMIHILLFLCAMSCFFFHFTDSFKASDGKIYYGFVTPCGLAVFMKPPPAELGGGDVIAEAEIPVIWMIIQRRLPNDQIVSLVYLGTPVLSRDVTSVFKTSIWKLRQRRLPDDLSESMPKSSIILISMKRQDTTLFSTTSISHFKSKVMPKAFWSLSYKLLANIKYVKERHNRLFNLLA